MGQYLAIGFASAFFPNDNQLKSFEEALDMFNDLVKRGLLKPRGYTLQTIEDSMKPSAFNVIA